jgi:amidase
MSYFDIGSDIGSSLRNPAHYCGVFSHKSSHGIVPLRGHGNARQGLPGRTSTWPAPWRSAYDLELILRAIAGPDAAEFPPGNSICRRAITPGWPIFAWPCCPRIRWRRSMPR